MSADSPSSANVTTYLAVEIGMGETQSSAARSTATTGSGGLSHGRRAGSPAARHKGRVSIKQKRDGKLAGYQPGYPAGFNPRAFTITAYLPNDGGKRLKVRVLLKSVFSPPHYFQDLAHWGAGCVWSLCYVH